LLTALLAPLRCFLFRLLSRIAFAKIAKHSPYRALLFRGRRIVPCRRRKRRRFSLLPTTPFLLPLIRHPLFLLSRKMLQLLWLLVGNHGEFQSALFPALLPCALREAHSVAPRLRYARMFFQDALNAGHHVVAA